MIKYMNDYYTHLIDERKFYFFDQVCIASLILDILQIRGKITCDMTQGSREHAAFVFDVYLQHPIWKMYDKTLKTYVA